jgi:hypothetical protein
MNNSSSRLQKIGNTAYNATLQVTEFASSSLAILIAISFFALIGIIIYVIIKIRKFSLRNVSLSPNPVIATNPVNGGAAVASAGMIPEPISGNEYSIYAWLYIDNLHDKQSDHKIVMYQGGSSSGFENASWLAFMDSNTNRLSVAVSTTGVDGSVITSGGPGSKITLKDVDANKFYLKAAIEYIPLQKWVLVAFVVKDATLSLYLDGELYTVSTIYDLPMRAGDVRPVVPKPMGDVILGAPAGMFGVVGFMARPTYSNYSMTMKQIRQVYEHGPYATSSLMRYLGMPNLAIRSPVYVVAPTTSVTGNNGEVKP